MTFCEQAKSKIEAGMKSRMGRFEEVMKREVGDALLDFCGQEEEFAQAVVQGGSFEDCMKAVAKCVHGNSISDAEAYGAAVRFYFPGAELKVEMRIDLIGRAAEESPEERGETQSGSDAVIIDLSSFF